MARGKGDTSGGTIVDSYGPRPNRFAIPNYGRGPDTPAQAAARQIAQKRKQQAEGGRLVGGDYVKGNWFDANNRQIGTAKTENSPIRFTTPRRLGNPRNR